MLKMLKFQNFVPVRVEFGAGKLETVGNHAKVYGKKALIVTTGPFFKETGLVGRIVGYLKEAGVQSEVFLDASPNPRSDEADKGAELAKSTGCDIVIGLGGGSAIDTAKCIAVGVAQGEPTWPYWIGEKTIFAALPIIAISTTSGTGSHITPYSVITNPATNEKPGAGADVMFPKVGIVDSQLMATVPQKVTAATGFDVLAHAIEAYTSNNATPFSDQYAQEAIKLVGKYLKRVVDNGSDAEARDAMALADTYGGYAISIAVVSMCHVIAQATGGVCNTVHGESLAALTPSSMRHSISGRPEKYKIIGELLSGKELGSPEESADIVSAFIKDIGMAIPLSKQGVKESDFNEIIEGSFRYMASGLDLDPVPVTKEDIRKILQESF
jgi:alcohol dehydrogenase class IV